MILRSLLFTTLLLSISCASKHHHDGKSAAKTIELNSGMTLKNHHNRVFLGPQVSEADILELKKEKNVTVVINLRTKGEMAQMNYKPENLTKAGIKYYNLPIDGAAQELDSEAYAKVEEVFMKHHKDTKEEVLVHCSSGNRAASWFSYHYGKGHGDEIDKSISVGQKYGMTDEALTEKTRRLLKKVK